MNEYVSNYMSDLMFLKYHGPIKNPRYLKVILNSTHWLQVNKRK